MAACKALLLLFLLGVLFGRGKTGAHMLPGQRGATFCQRQRSPESLNMNLFQELLTNYTADSRELQQAPYVRGTDTRTPAYEFSGTGFSMSKKSTSDALRQASCSTNEVTFYGSVYFKDSNSGGTLLDVSYSEGAGSMIPVYEVYLDAEADTVSLSYRHLAQLRTETFSVRLTGGRWGRYAFVLSGNLLKLFVNCREIYRRLVPLPDFCANDSSLVVTIADSAEHSEEYITGLYAFLQDVGVQFGPGGILNQCPQANESCPTCGQFLKLVQKADSLRDEVETLRSRVANIERDGCTPSKDTPTPPTNLGRSCILPVDMRTFNDGEFARNSDGQICYCRNGNPSCTTITDICANTNSTNTTSPPGRDPGTQGPPAQMCAPAELGGQTIAVNSTAFLYEEDENRCTVFFCQVTQFGVAAPTEFFECASNYTNCSMNFDPFQQRISQCCRLCRACDFASCPNNSQCISQGESSHRCDCNDGYEMVDGKCRDIDECKLGRQHLGHNCPEKSQCINLPGSEGKFDCRCASGFSMVVGANQVRRCMDDNECSDPIRNNCSANSRCINLPGSFQCICSNGYQMDANGQCMPICNPACLNGGQCVRPGECNCPIGFFGDACEKDVNECGSNSSNTCDHPMAECVNTVGGYFCRCRRGFRMNGTECRDVDECALRIHNCVRRSRCINTIGSYTCVCPGNISCFGSCIRHGRMIPNRGYVLEGSRGCQHLRNCTCIDGELTCHKRVCDCSRRGIDLFVNRSCCPECYRRNCDYNGNQIRPDSTLVDPQNPCVRCYCSKHLALSCTNVSSQCPRLACPRQFQVTPSGRCCPVCMLPPCNAVNNGTTIPVRNGCKSCTCKNSNWDCTSVNCPAVQCDPREILFNKGNCCPICANQALGLQSCTS